MASENTQQNNEQQSQRKLAAIMFTDIKDFSKKMQENETATMRLLETHNRMMETSVAKYGGNVIKTIGDAYLVSFENVLSATQCAMEIQENFFLYNNNKCAEEKITIRAGVHLGDVIVKGNDVFGDGVNIASRIQSMAEPGGVNISGSVYEQIKNKLDIRVTSLGIPQLKNIKEHVKIYQVVIDPNKKMRGKVASQLVFAKTLLMRKRTRTILLASFVFVALAVEAFLYLRKPAAHNSIALLPFENTGASAFDYLVDGISDELIDRISKLKNLLVISRGSSFFYKGKNISEQEFAKELNVRFVLSGSVRVSDAQLKISVRLSDVQKGKTRWTERYDISKSELLQTQNDISRRVASYLDLEISEEDSKVAPEVYDVYLRGLYEVRKIKRESNYTAIAQFTNAIERDSLFASAYVELANAQLFNVDWQWDVNESWLDEAEKNCKKALALDSTLGSAYGILGRIAIAKGKQAEGVELLEHSVRLNQNDITSLSALGEIYAFNLNNPKKAITYFTQSQTLEPTNPTIVTNLAVGYAMLNNNLEAIRNFRKAISVDSTYGDAWRNLGIFFEKISSFDSALVSYAKALQCNPIDYNARVSLCGIYLVQEQFRQAESLMISGIHLEPSNFRFRYPLGIALFHEGKKKEAIGAWNEGLQKALVESERNPNLSEHKLSISLFNARLGNTNEALWRGKQAFALDSTNSDIVIGLAHLYAVLEQKNDMLYWFNRAKTMAPDFDEAYLRTALDFEQYRNDSELLTIAKK
jgi:class 3 adenylate cyclase/TolB-like protein/Flp pilus assembly protein TadD